MDRGLIQLIGIRLWAREISRFIEEGKDPDRI